MSLRKLLIVFDNDMVGELLEEDRGKFSFKYDNAWISNGFPLSLCLPLRNEPYGNDLTMAWFANLLPEESILDGICRAKKIDKWDLLSFFGIFGKECAGAFSIVKELPSYSEEVQYRDVTEEVRKYLKSGYGANLYVVTDAKLSASGAQNKLPVLFDGERLHLPENLEPTSHIIKTDPPIYKHLSRNEHFCMALAKKCGLYVANTQLLIWEEGDLYVTQRFDRLIQNGEIKRLHQEDFCQAMGLESAYKYHRSGGYDGLSAMRDICLKNNIEIGDFFAKAMIFNLIIGNGDAHAKNYSITFLPDKRKKVSPMYDLVCTDVYDGLDPTFAMAFGRAWKKEEIEPVDIFQMLEDSGCPIGKGMAIAKDVPEKILANVDKLATSHANAYGEAEIYQLLAERIVENARKFLEIKLDSRLKIEKF